MVSILSGHGHKNLERDIPVVGFSTLYYPDLYTNTNVRRNCTYDHSAHSAISAPSTISVWMIPSRLLPLLTAFTQQL